MREPIEQMLHPGSISEYTELTEKYGLDLNKGIDPDIDYRKLYKDWYSLLRADLTDCNYEKIKKKYYPDTEINEEEQPFINLYSGESAVRAAVLVHEPLMRRMYSSGKRKIPVYPYFPVWKTLSNFFGPAQPGMQNLTELEVINILEHLNEKCGLFNILRRSNKLLNIVILDDADVHNGGAALVAKQDGMMIPSIILTRHEDRTNPYDSNMYPLLFALCSVLYCYAFDLESGQRNLPLEYFSELTNIFRSSTLLSQGDSGLHEILLSVMCEGMLKGTDFEKDHCILGYLDKKGDTPKRVFDKITDMIK